MKIKVCGVSTLADVEKCIAAGVDWIGLNFHPGSTRRIDVSRAMEIQAALAGRAEAVGLFVDRLPGEIVKIAGAVGFDLVQLHGSEPPGDLPRLVLSGLRVIKAFRISGSDSIAAIDDYLARATKLGCPPFAILVDAYVQGIAGGTGVSIDDDLLGQIPSHPRLILAGGLTPENVAQRLTRIRPWMVNVASGVESSPGIKCAERIAAFVEAARHHSGPST